MSCSLSLVALMFFSGVGQEQIEAPAVKKPELRCAYIGRMGSFHLIGKGGSAAYEFRDGKKFVADLLFTREDRNFRYYTPSNGDPATTEWAFGKIPECGMYWVWRRISGRFYEFEPTRGWGEGLDRGRFTAGDFTGPSIPQRVQALEDRVDKLEDKKKKQEQKKQER